MEYKFSPEEFSSLVSSSIQSSTTFNGVADSHSTDLKIKSPMTDAENHNTPDDLDDLDNLDDLENLDDLDNLDNLENLEEQENYSEPITRAKETQSIKQDALPNFLKFVTLEQDEKSKIPVYSCDIIVESEHMEQSVASTAFQLIAEILDKSFMITADCKTYCDLWNANFVASKVSSELLAFDRFLAMLFHIACYTDDVVLKIMNANSADLLKRLENYGRVITFKDVEIECGEREPDKVTEEEQLPHDVISIEGTVEQQTENVSDNASDEFIDGADFIPETDDEDAVEEKPAKLTKKAKLKLFAQMLFDNVLTDTVRDRFSNLKSIQNCYNSIVQLLCNSVITPAEFTHFVLFLSQTREIVLDPALVKHCKTFNKYFLTLLSKNYDIEIPKDAEFHDSVFIIEAETGKVCPVFWDYIALNWRLFQLTVKKKSTVVFIDYLDKKLALIQMQKGTKPRKMIFQPTNSQYTTFANAFSEAAMNYLDTFNSIENFKYNIQCDQLDFYYLISKGYAIPKQYSVLSRQQRQSLNQLLAYSHKYNQDMLKVIAEGQVDPLCTVNVCNLAKNHVIADYQIIAYCLSTFGQVSVSMSQSTLLSPIFVLSGDGIPEKDLELTFDQMSKHFRRIGEHVRMSSTTRISVSAGKLVISFKK